MSVPVFTWTDQTDAIAVGSLSFNAIPGTPSAAQEVHLWNQQGGSTADTALNLALQVLVSDGSTSVFYASGKPAVDQLWIQAQILGVEGAAIGLPTAWTPLGNGAMLPLPDLPANSAVKLRLRVSAPASADPPSVVSVLWRILSSPVVPVGSGFVSDPDGVLSGLGDGTFTGFLVGGVVTESSTPAATVEVPYLAGVVEGVPIAVAAITEALNANDGASVALAAGQEYQALLAIAASGLTVTKGVLASAGTSVPPGIPADVVPVAMVVRPFSAVIVNANITMLTQLSRFGISTSGLITTLSQGQARVGGNLARQTGTQQVTLTASTTNWLWIDSDGFVEATPTADRPSPLSSLIYELDTDGSSVTAIRDRRIFIGPSLRRLRLRFNATLAAAAVSEPEVLEDPRAVMIDPERPATLALDDLGSGLTGGETRIDIQCSIAGGSWVSIFAIAADMLRVAFGATNPVTNSASPATVLLPAGSRIRARIDAVATGGSPVQPAGATVILPLHLR